MEQKLQVVPEVVQEKTFFTNINLSRKRGVDEEFTDYKKRMKQNNLLVKNHSKGRFVWKSCCLTPDTESVPVKWIIVKQQGTYRKGM